MFLTVGSFITTMLFSSIMLSLILLICMHKKVLLQWGTNVLFAASALVAIRMLVPVEFIFAKTYHINYSFPTPYIFFRYPLFQLWDYQVRIWHIFLVIWGVVASTKLLMLSIHYRRFKKSLFANIFEPSYDIRKSVAVNIGEQYGSKVRVLFCKNIQTPLLFGLLNPVIVLPKIYLSIDEWDFVLKHEISHLKHNDLWYKLTLDIVKMIYWWNPLIYIFCKKTYRALEIRADQSVVSKLPAEKRIDYADCLLKVAKQRRLKNQEIPSLFFDSVQRSTMYQRIQLILNDYPISKQKQIGKKLFSILLISAMFLSTFVVLEAYMVPEEVDESTFTITPENAFLVVSESDGKYDLYVNGTYLTTVEGGEGSFEDLTIYESKDEILESNEHQSSQNANTLSCGDVYFYNS